eukprot:Unigene8241_Nuclearia_a/m.25297 Unigene8241_Nuclearia_a/g.25297  ORF Unigene8241_Nuclearia_a/g.25297 Unigene8241_Nuclearia_a/m.25297 type:complete len:130 (+) Unigene8241_Nuclearia_a:225-614(+)
MPAGSAGGAAEAAGAGESLADVLDALRIGDEVFTPERLREHDGTAADRPVYVAIKGIVFDVSSNRESYGPGMSYNIFAGKDASRALGMSSLKLEDCSPDYSTLSPKQMETLDSWLKYYAKKYPAVGRVR